MNYIFNFLAIFNSGSCLILLRKLQFTDPSRNTSVTLKSLFPALIPKLSKNYYEPVLWRSKHIISGVIRREFDASRSKKWGKGAAVQFGAE